MPEPKVPSGYHGVSVVEYFREFDERHFGVGASHVNYPPAESLAKRVGAEITNLDLVANLDEFEVAVHHLIGEDAPETVEKAGSLDVPDPHRCVTVADMVLESFVYADFPPLACFLFIDRETVSCQELLPGQPG